jgi:lysophospholipase L1-like esterase
MRVRILAIIAIIICVSMTPLKKTKIVFFGDSITQQGAGKGGYIDLIQEKINTKGLQNDWEVAGAGIGGNKVYDLYLRMEDDVLAKNPDVVVIYIGINDVWHKASSGTGTDKDKFEKFYIAIIKKLQAKNIKVYVCTPSVIGELKDSRNQQDGDLNAYGDVIRNLATTNNCTLIDLRNAFMAYDAKNNAENKDRGVLTTDRVHLNPAGNQLVAAEMMKALGIPQ